MIAIDDSIDACTGITHWTENIEIIKIVKNPVDQFYW